MKATDSFQVESEKLSDGSQVFSVAGCKNGDFLHEPVTFYCQSEAHAKRLKAELDLCSDWDVD